MLKTLNIKLMWKCPTCNRSFRNVNQNQCCAGKDVTDFLVGKTENVCMLYNEIMSTFENIGPIHLSATKSMIVIAADTGFAYIIKLGKDFIDVVLPFSQPFTNNLCFRKIALVPGTTQYNHHLRIILAEDLNDEVIEYFKIAYANGKTI
ncbi:MAG: hypothetical protein EOP00_25075 [Pedobacter sp.]|nr:MAG: hypothetical protein EOP00_25075 [Pedobacter sp.]